MVKLRSHLSRDKVTIRAGPDWAVDAGTIQASTVSSLLAVAAV